MVENELESLGLNKLESEVYLALQELGEARTGIICKKLNIPNSHIYTTLNSLTQKGLVSCRYANNVKIFKPSNPETLKILFEKKQEEIKQQEKSLNSLIENLKQLPKNKETISDYQYFEGINSLKNLIFEIYSNAPIGSEIILFSAKSESWERLNAFLMEMHKIRAKRKVNMKMILQKGSVNLKGIISERKKLGYVETRVTDFNNNAEFLCTENEVIILDLSKITPTPCGFMIKNKVFVSLFKEIFNFIWENSKG